MSLHIAACGLSDVGRSRTHNEDAFRIDAERGLFVVADGMGGHGHGDVASRIAVEAIAESLAGGGGAAGGRPQGARSHGGKLREAILRAHRRVVGAIERDRSLVGMGTTVVGLVAGGQGRGAIAHVGDSRAYRLRDGVLELVTEDHTWVNEQVLAGVLSEDQARSHPLKSVVTRAIGGDGDVEVDVRELELRPGDRFLLCSDGLTTMLSDEEIESRLQGAAPLDEICRSLVSSANGQGGLDNITVLLLAVEDGRPDDA